MKPLKPLNMSGIAVATILFVIGAYEISQGNWAGLWFVGAGIIILLLLILGVFKN